MKRQLLPDNVFELLFGVGAGVVIIGALLKIINGSLIFSANTWLIVGLSVEAGIFVLSGIQGFLLGKQEEEEDAVNTIAVETAALQKAVDGTVRGLSELNSNISSASKATASIRVPGDMEKNTEDFKVQSGRSWPKTQSTSNDSLFLESINLTFSRKLF